MLMFLAGRITYGRCTLIYCLPKRLSLQSHSPGSSLPPTPLLGERGQCRLTSLRLSFLICRWRGSEDEIACVNACVLTVQFSVHPWPRAELTSSALVTAPLLTLSSLPLTFMCHFSLLFMYQTNASTPLLVFPI